MKVLQIIFCIISLFLSAFTGNSFNNNSCLTAKADSPCELISQSQLSSLLGISENEIEIKGPWEGAKKTEYMQCTFSWNTGRKTTMKTQYVEMELDQDDMVRVGSCTVLDKEKIKVSYEEYFKNKYRQLTEAEKKSIEKRFEEKSKEEDLSETQTDVGKSMLTMMSNISYEYEQIGDRAVWEYTPKSKDATLIVLKENIIFTVSVNISDEDTENKEAARKVVKQILANCD